MSERQLSATDLENIFAQLMKKLSGHRTPTSGHDSTVTAGNSESKSIVDVTEELLRQLGK